jgi:hypothetical protein
MNHWLLDTVNETRGQALKQAESVQIFGELLDSPY